MCSPGHAGVVGIRHEPNGLIIEHVSLVSSPKCGCSIRVEDLPAIADIRFTEDMIPKLGDGRKLSVPIEWYSRLAHGKREERANWRLFANGHAIEWPDLDEHLHIEGLLAGRRSSDSQQSIERWLASRAASRQE